METKFIYLCMLFSIIQCGSMFAAAGGPEYHTDGEYGTGPDGRTLVWIKRSKLREFKRDWKNAYEIKRAQASRLSREQADLGRQIRELESRLSTTSRSLEKLTDDLKVNFKSFINATLLDGIADSSSEIISLTKDWKIYN
ncbi:hypothetical protein EBQ93_02450, partial [bacterium]|nr:hypothetical protein [bacterium]